MLVLALLAACSESATPSDASTVIDNGTVDNGTVDTGPVDTGRIDSSPVDTGPRDAGSDASAPDVATQDVVDHDGHAIDVPADTGPIDTGPVDTGPSDTGPSDTGMTDAGPADVGCGDTMTDRNNCGGCGRVCCAGNVCAGGMCVNACSPGITSCPPATPPVGCFGGNICVSTQTDSNNCGMCGRVCCAGVRCNAGACVPSCAAGLNVCPPSTPPVGCSSEGVCVDFRTDDANCGMCGRACPAGQVCSAGDCQAPFTAVAPCNAPGDYTTGSTVRFGGAVGTAYEPRCLTVRVGDSVTFEGAFSGHPLAPSSRGTSGNPITRTASGTTTTFRFTAAGHFPYFCEFHGTDGGGGMAGVVRVTE